MDRIISAGVEAKKNQQKSHARLAVSGLKFEPGTTWLRNSIITRFIVPVFSDIKEEETNLGRQNVLDSWMSDILFCSGILKWIRIIFVAYMKTALTRTFSLTAKDTI